MNPTTAPASMDEEGSGPASPFFPSSARTNEGGTIPSDFFLDSELCGECHKDVYEQWKGSVHHFASFNNQFYRKSIEDMQSVVGTRPSKWCAGCHDHAVFFNGRFDRPIKEQIDTPEAHIGLSCTSCHSITKVDSSLGNGSFTIEYPGIWLALWQRFDANWYTTIAENGYGSIPGDVHFPPLYPLLMRVLQPVFQGAFPGGLFLSHLATLYALKLLYDLFLQWGDRQTARRALLFFAIYPTFFFCFRAYTEPVFLVTALLAFRSMSHKSWGWAGFWIFCSILIRLQGVALLAPLLYLIWRDPPLLRQPGHWAGPLIAGMGGLAYLYLRFISSAAETLPFAETSLHARLVPPWQSYWMAVQTLLGGNATFIDLLNFAAAALVIFLLFWGWKQVPLEYKIYTVCSLLIIIARVVETQPLVSLSRYSLTFFPVFFTLAVAGQNPWTRRLVVYTSILLSLYLSGQFFLWGWVA